MSSDIIPGYNMSLLLPDSFSDIIDSMSLERFRLSLDILVAVSAGSKSLVPTLFMIVLSILS